MRERELQITIYYKPTGNFKTNYEKTQSDKDQMDISKK